MRRGSAKRDDSSRDAEAPSSADPDGQTDSGASSTAAATVNVEVLVLVNARAAAFLSFLLLFLGFITLKFSVAWAVVAPSVPPFSAAKAQPCKASAAASTVTGVPSGTPDIVSAAARWDVVVEGEDKVLDIDVDGIVPSSSSELEALWSASSGQVVEQPPSNVAPSLARAVEQQSG